MSLASCQVLLRTSCFTPLLTIAPSAQCHRVHSTHAPIPCHSTSSMLTLHLVALTCQSPCLHLTCLTPQSLSIPSNYIVPMNGPRSNYATGGYRSSSSLNRFSSSCHLLSRSITLTASHYCLSSQATSLRASSPSVRPQDDRPLGMILVARGSLHHYYPTLQPHSR
jgi:hypothetical protein